MDEKVKQTLKDIIDTLMSTGTAKETNDLLEVHLRVLWMNAQIDFMENNPPKVLNITLDK